MGERSRPAREGTGGGDGVICLIGSVSEQRSRSAPPAGIGIINGLAPGEDGRKVREEGTPPRPEDG